MTGTESSTWTFIAAPPGWWVLTRNGDNGDDATGARPLAGWFADGKRPPALRPAVHSEARMNVVPCTAEFPEGGDGEWMVKRDEELSAAERALVGGEWGSWQ